MDVLLISSDERSCWHLARYLEQLGCACWFASTSEEIQLVLSRRPFGLVLSTRPITEQGPLITLLRSSDRFVFLPWGA